MELHITHFMKTLFRYKLVNRIISFIIFTSSVYFLVSLISQFIDISRFTVNLVMFVTLSLLPVFLLFHRNVHFFKRTLRKIDRNCILESYFAAEGETKDYIGKKAEPLVNELKMRNPLNFTLSRHTIRLLCFFVLVLFLLQLASLLAYGNLTLTHRLPEQKQITEEQKNRREYLALRENEEVIKLDSDKRPAEFQGDHLSRDVPEESEEGNSILSMEQLLRQIKEKVEGRRKSDDYTEDRSVEGDEGEMFLRNRLSGEYGLDKGTTTSGGERERREEAPLQNMGKGFEDTGKSFLDSPMLDYRTIAEKIYSERSREGLKATLKLSAEEQTELIRAYFGDFRSTVELTGLDDPELEKICTLYLSLLEKEIEKRE